MFVKSLLKKRPLSARLLLFAVLPLALLLLWFWSYLRTSLPIEEGLVEVTAIEQPVTLGYDDQGMVHISAKTDHDAYFALGYAHASDRLWQLEMQRRIASGTLSEVLGKRTLSQDIWLRTLGLSRAAQSSWDSLSEDAKGALSAYTKGINSRIEQLTVLPTEFLMMGFEPKPWHELDSLAWMKVFSLNLSGNMWSELNNMIALQMLGEDRSASLIKHYPEQGVTTLKFDPAQSLTQLFQYKDELQQQLDIGGRFVGSNAWVVGPEHTDNGQAQLANDPHLGLQMPSLWYAASVKGHRLDVSGMTLVGLPLVIFGRNKEISWGGTNMMADAQDLRLETVSVSKPGHYLNGEKWLPFVERTEVIEVKADSPASLRVPLAPVNLVVRETVNGPVISDVVKGFSQPVTLRWSALDEHDTSFEAFYRLGYAGNWQGFKQALSLYISPAMNMLYADKRNNIGYQAAGKIPVRAVGQGMVPTKGDNPANGWQGYIPFAQMPSQYNPPEGYLVSANNKVIDDSYPHFISNDWAEPARAERIKQLLNEKINRGEKVSLDYAKSMQMDEFDATLVLLRDYLVSQKTQFAEQHRYLLDILANWDGRVSRDSNAAALLQVWHRHLKNALYIAAIEDNWGQKSQMDAVKRLVDGISNEQMVSALNAGNLWCSHAQGSELRSCSDVLLESLDSALAELDLFVGSDADDWRWGEIHQANFSHLPFSQINLIDRWFTREFEAGGSANSLNVSNAQYVELQGYEMTFGAGFRQVITMGDKALVHDYVNSTGQSGNPLSSHFDDAISAYSNGEFYSAIAKGNYASTLTLTPKAR